MTDQEVLRLAVSSISPRAQGFHLLRRNGSIHLALPHSGGAAGKTLGLYQPQRRFARMIAAGLKCLSTVGLHMLLPAKWKPTDNDSHTMQPILPDIEEGSLGIMLGSPEHRIRRAIVSYRTPDGWEVGKVTFGQGGADLLDQEAAVLNLLSASDPAVPRCLGLHDGDGIRMLRMPYLTGGKVNQGESDAALALLDRWVTSSPVAPACDFPEWKFIADCLNSEQNGSPWIDRIAHAQLRPVTSHGDFARWNLLTQPEGGLIVLDWEWGREAGMPGLDLVHYFLQDERLVSRRPERDAIAATLKNLDRPRCRAYLQKTGWGGDPLQVIIASLAYKQGAGHQENSSVLKAALSFSS